MREFGFIIILIAAFVGTTYAQQVDSIVIGKHKTVTLTAAQFNKVSLNYCDTFSLEVSGFYPILKIEPTITDDTIHIVHLLKIQGFKVVNSEWGNWTLGPRIFRIDMEKGNCKCSVIKLYYNYKKMKNGNYSMKITEKVFCNKSFKYVGE